MGSSTTPASGGGSQTARNLHTFAAQYERGAPWNSRAGLIAARASPLAATAAKKSLETDVRPHWPPSRHALRLRPSGRPRTADDPAASGAPLPHARAELLAHGHA